MSSLGVWSEEAYSYLLTPLGNVVSILAIIIFLFIAAKITSKKGARFNAKSLCFCAIAIALSTVTSFIKFVDLPMGGSLTLCSMFFICLIGYLYGAGCGITTGVAYGILQLVMDPYIVHPAQLILEYPIAFGFLGLSGIFSESKNGLLKGVVLGIMGRFICHIIAAVIFFGAYAPEGMNTLIYAITYNGAYIIPELILTVIIISIPTVKKALETVKNMA